IQEKAIAESFRCHSGSFFPGVMQLDRPTFVRQAARLWAVKERLSSERKTAIVERFAWPICHGARAKRSRLFRGEAASGWDHTHTQAFSGLRVHASVCLPDPWEHGRRSGGARSERRDARIALGRPPLLVA
ncbi:MAG TPA: hypothetical protein VGF67_00760, partial [Ktedonobacteraceae bacterium]